VLVVHGGPDLPRETADEISCLRDSVLPKGAGPLTAAEDARSDQVIEAGHDGAAGDAHGGGQRPLGRDAGAFAEHPALDGIQQRRSEALVAGAGPLPPAAEHHFCAPSEILIHSPRLALSLPRAEGQGWTMLKDLGSPPTPLVADACVRSGVPLRAAPHGISALAPGHRIAGRALPARHYGSVDVFLEALGRARPGDVLVIDNGGRADEACIGDLVVLEARAAGLAGLAVWGLHRDGPELAEIGLPVFSYGCYPAGPARLDQREPEALAAARFGPHQVTGDDFIFGDGDGVLFVGAGHVAEVLATAQQIWQAEREQARRIRDGETLRQQTDFDGYLTRRAADPSYTFRQHLRQVGGAIEE
jgi:4-hydroxy-4-methyl-2-oxoglutarate aldolase